MSTSGDEIIDRCGLLLLRYRLLGGEAFFKMVTPVSQGRDGQAGEMGRLRVMLRFVPARALVLAFLALALFATLGVTGDVAQANAEKSDVIIKFAGPPNQAD